MEGRLRRNENSLDAAIESCQSILDFARRPNGRGDDFNLQKAACSLTSFHAGSHSVLV
jgi:hypothetical protein